ncbi:uncharacterized protein EDB91DRAFT_1146053 [Suillus paluster]|uniref:uncharacterized protein n=1 Tax=Suillus paluster TaxID=48578 RepID=UPI001B86A5B8|nr:uncharacterized protein EDB91DRAFT_1146053 [Suillus paluster]KAG1734931.1 hypothetical protein EDB91DRAFT_1146053 [Suillus paluster]
MSHKRKYRKAASKTSNLAASAAIIAPDLSLSIQAYEATVIRGPQSLSTALSLEVPDPPTLGADANDPQIGSALLQWGTSTRNFLPFNSDPSFPEASDDKATWVDRYDARLLLDALPGHASSNASQPRSLSPTGWSDLPSDTEDTFFFAPLEIEDYQREKRRRLIDRNREERLRALAATDESEHSDLWGCSDEEVSGHPLALVVGITYYFLFQPDDAQSELMKRTALHLMRILANHGADKRFAFLRGRWSRAWRTTKEKLRQEKVNQSVQSLRASQKAGLGGLAAYGDSDDEGSEEGSESGDIPSLKVGESSTATSNPPENRDARLEEAEQEARRARAREWAAQRRTRQGQTLSRVEDQSNSSDS